MSVWGGYLRPQQAVGLLETSNGTRMPEVYFCQTYRKPSRSAGTETADGRRRTLVVGVLVGARLMCVPAEEDAVRHSVVVAVGPAERDAKEARREEARARICASCSNGSLIIKI